MTAQMSQPPPPPIVPDISKLLTTGNFEKAIRSSLERAVPQEAAKPRSTRQRLSVALLLARLRDVVVRGAGAVRAPPLRRRR